MRYRKRIEKFKSLFKMIEIVKKIYFTNKQRKTSANRCFRDYFARKIHMYLVNYLISIHIFSELSFNIFCKFLSENR